MARRVERADGLTARQVQAMRMAERKADALRWRAARRALLERLPDDALWHVALVVAGREARAERALVEAGFHAYCPLERVTIGRGATRVDVERPLFPRYVFFARREAGAVIAAVRDVMEVLGGSGGRWAVAPDCLVKALIDSEGLGVFDRSASRLAALAAARRKRLSTGDKVTIARGPFAGFPAEIMALRSETRVACLVRMFGGNVPMEVDIDSIAAAA